MFFREKDVLTLGNILSGFTSIIFVLQGKILHAKIMIFVAMIFDLFDGYVARTFFKPNKFGKELDNLADLISYNVAPSVLVYHYLAPYSTILAYLTGACVITAGALRLARFNVNRMEVPGYFLGLPRPISATLIVAFLSTSFFTMLAESSPLIPAAFIFLLSVLNITAVPYIGHHGRVFDTRIKIAIFLLLLLGIFAGMRSVLWEFIFATGFIYMLYPWTLLPPEIKNSVAAQVEKWSRDE